MNPLIKELKSLTEARRSDLDYQEKLVKGQLDRITVDLTGHESGTFTKVGTRFKELKQLIEELETKRNDLNAEIKTMALELFDAEDEVLTKVVDTVSIVITISKLTPATEKEEVNHEKAMKMILDTMPQLKDEIEKITKACTEIKKVAAKSPGLRIDVKEGILDPAIKLIKSYAEKIRDHVKSWSKQYDAKLDAVRKVAGI